MIKKISTLVLLAAVLSLTAADARSDDSSSGQIPADVWAASPMYSTLVAGMNNGTFTNANLQQYTHQDKYTGLWVWNSDPAAQQIANTPGLWINASNNTFSVAAPSGGSLPLDSAPQAYIAYPAWQQQQAQWAADQNAPTGNVPGGQAYHDAYAALYAQQQQDLQVCFFKNGANSLQCRQLLTTQSQQMQALNAQYANNPVGSASTSSNWCPLSKPGTPVYSGSDIPCNTVQNNGQATGGPGTAANGSGNQNQAAGKTASLAGAPPAASGFQFSTTLSGSAGQLQAIQSVRSVQAKPLINPGR